MDITPSQQQEISRRQESNNAAYSAIAQARAQISALEEQLARLQRELAELEDFRIQTRNDFARLREQANERKTALSALDAIPNVDLFRRLASAMGDTIDRRTKAAIENASSDVGMQINRAAGDIQSEIDSLKTQIASLGRTIADNQALISRNNASIAAIQAG